MKQNIICANKIKKMKNKTKQFFLQNRTQQKTKKNMKNKTKKPFFFKNNFYKTKKNCKTTLYKQFRNKT